MNKRNVRSFLFGIIFATSVLAIYYYFLNDVKDATIDTSSAKTLLLDENYIVLTEQELIDAKEEAVQEAIVSLLDEEEPVVEDDYLTYSLVVRPGVNATTITTLLAENGIVDDEAEFQLYLTSNGYSKKIRVGTYELNSTMSYEEIVNIITTISD